MYRSAWCLLALIVLVPLSGWISAAPVALADKKKDDKVEEMMEKVHEGKKSPWKQAQAATAKNPPDWDVLAGQLEKLEKMSTLLKNSKVSDISDSSDSYVNAVTALAAKTKAKDAEGVRKAISSLSKSCADCHFKGGVGGELEDD